MKRLSDNFFGVDSATSIDYSATFVITGGELDVLASLVYEQALRLVEYIDRSLELGTHHFRLKSGRLLRTLDEVVSAILKNELAW